MYTPSKNSRVKPQIQDPHKFHSKCVCQICTCGKHSCPEKNLKFEGETTHHDHYKPYQINREKVQSLPYNPQQRHYDTNLLQSSYNSAYKPHEVHMEKPIRYDYHPVSSGKFDSETEYKKSYNPHKITMEKPAQSLAYSPNRAKFDGTTTYNQQYSTKYPGKDLSGSRAYQYRPSNIKFEGKTTYESQYKPHTIEQSYNEKLQYQPKHVPFVGQSRYKQSYIPYEIQPPKVCPTELLPVRPTRCSPGKQHMHYTASRNKWE